LYQPIEGLSGKSSVKLSLTGCEPADETDGFETLVSLTGRKPPRVSLRARKIPNRARPATQSAIVLGLVIFTGRYLLVKGIFSQIVNG
jgi:hypothetical protein